MTGYSLFHFFKIHYIQKKRSRRSWIYMGFLYMLLIGLVIGAVAKLLLPGKDPGGCIITMLIGIVGSVIAGYVGRALGWYAEGEPAGFIMSVVGAILLLLGYRMILGKK